MGRQAQGAVPPASRRRTAASPGERGLQGPEEVRDGLSPQPLQNQPCPQLGETAQTSDLGNCKRARVRRLSHQACSCLLG